MEDPVKMFEAALGEAGNPQFQGALNKLFKSSDELVGTQARVGAQAAQDQVTAQRSRARDTERIREIENKIDTVQALQDPSKYQTVKQSDGSIAFFRPDGVQISPGEYAQITGKSIPDVFSGTDNLYQQQFQNDYENWKKLGELWNKNDSEGIKKMLGETDPELLKEFQEGKTFDEFSREFISGYDDIFGGRSAGTSQQASEPLEIGGNGNPIVNFLKNLFSQ